MYVHIFSVLKFSHISSIFLHRWNVCMYIFFSTSCQLASEGYSTCIMYIRITKIIHIGCARMWVARAPEPPYISLYKIAPRIRVTRAQQIFCGRLFGNIDRRARNCTVVKGTVRGKTHNMKYRQPPYVKIADPDFFCRLPGQKQIRIPTVHYFNIPSL